MEIILITFSTLYFFIWIITFLGILKHYKKTNNIDKMSVSIVISARNEEENISKTLSSLKKLDLEKLDWEIILVNDASEDNTLKIMKNFKNNYLNTKIINIREKNKDLKGKKYAITRAVRKAKGEYIFFTDADCTVGRKWIKTGLKYFTPETGLIMGHIKYRDGLFINLESIIGSIFTFSWAFINNSPYCSGGNIAVKKSKFIKSGGYSDLPNIASGDDTFLLQKIKKISSIKPVFDKNFFVKTDYIEEKESVKDKNKRKYAKNFLMEPFNIVLFFFGILYHILLIYNLLFNFGANILIILLFKFFLEYLIFIIGAARMKETRYILYYPIFIIYYPFKIIYYSFLGFFKGYRWKSEKNIH